LNKQFVIPPEASAAFVANMEDVLDVYHRPHDPECPVVCLDETSKQLIAETRVPIPAKSGRTERYDYVCRRNGTAIRCLFDLKAARGQHNDPRPLRQLLWR
jgi:hypothetical protein